MSGLTPYGNLQRAPIGRANPNESGGPRLMRSNRAESDSLMRQWGYTRSRRKRTAETTGRQPVVPVETDTRTKNKTDDNDIPGPKKSKIAKEAPSTGDEKGKGFWLGVAQNAIGGAIGGAVLAGMTWSAKKSIESKKREKKERKVVPPAQVANTGQEERLTGDGNSIYEFEDARSHIGDEQEERLAADGNNIHEDARSRNDV